MFDLIQLILKLFINPLEGIGIIVILGLMIAGLRWGLRRAAHRSKFNLPLNAAPDFILRYLLQFMDEDLQYNRSATISPKQIKRLRNEFRRLLIAWLVLIVVAGFVVATIYWGDMFRWGFDLVGIGALGIVGLMFLFLIGLAVFQLQGYIQDLKTKKVVALLSPLVLEEHEGEFMGFKFSTHQYKIIVNDSRLGEPLSLPIGFMSEDMWYQVKKLRRQSAILYVAQNTSKLLSFELVATEPEISQRNVR